MFFFLSLQMYSQKTHATNKWWHRPVVNCVEMVNFEAKESRAYFSRRHKCSNWRIVFGSSDICRHLNVNYLRIRSAYRQLKSRFGFKTVDTNRNVFKSMEIQQHQRHRRQRRRKCWATFSRVDSKAIHRIHHPMAMAPYWHQLTSPAI